MKIMVSYIVAGRKKIKNYCLEMLLQKKILKRRLKNIRKKPNLEMNLFYFLADMDLIK